jgi:hypothetical protein
MKKSYKLSHNDYLLSKIGSSFTKKVYTGDPEVINKAAPKNNANFLIKGFVGFIVVFIGVVLLFNLLMNVFQPNENPLFIVLNVFIPVFAIIGAILFMNKMRIKKVIADRENLAGVSNTKDVTFVELDNNNLEINLFNSDDIKVNIPMDVVNNIYFVPGDLSLITKHRFRFAADEMDTKLSTGFNGYRIKEKNKPAPLIIDGKAIQRYRHHGMFEINKKVDYYNQYLNKHLGIKIEGKIEDNGYFLFIFTNTDYHLFYVPNFLIEEGFLQDLNQVLFNALGKEIQTPSTYEETGGETIQLLPSSLFKPSDDDITIINNLRKKLEVIKYETAK